MKTCSRCGEEKPPEGFYATGRVCRICNRKRTSEWQRNNPERVAELRAKDYARHGKRRYLAKREKMLARQAKRRDDPEFRAAQKEYHRRWYQANREREAARQRTYYLERREHLIEQAVAWAQANPDKRRVTSLADKQRRRGLALTAEDKSYLPILLTDPCAYCGGPAGEIDHIVAVTAGGDGGWQNLTAACRSCNASKHTRSLLQHLRAA